MSSAVQLSFSIRVSTAVKSVHLLGSWDKYQRHLPLAPEKDGASCSGWKATLRFHGELVKPGRRYWYYYLIDGYHCSHNPSEPSTAEPTTGRMLNILDVPPASRSKSSASSSSSKSKSKSKRSGSSDSGSDSSRSSRRRAPSTSSTSSGDSRKERSHKSSSTSERLQAQASSQQHSRHPATSRRDPAQPFAAWQSLTLEIPKGRPLSISQIKAPKPVSPYATRLILDEAFGPDAGLDALAIQLGASDLLEDAEATLEDDSDSVSEDEFAAVSSGSDCASDRCSAASLSPSLARSSPLSSDGARSVGSGYSTPESECARASPCVCERYGITRDGRRLKLDCRGVRCGAFGQRSSAAECALDSATDSASTSGDDQSSSCSSAESDDDDDVLLAQVSAKQFAAAALAGGKQRLPGLDVSLAAAAVATAAAAADPLMSPMAARRHAIYMR